MCKFKSGIVIPTAGGGFDLLHNPYTDSHEELVRIFKLNDTAKPGGSVRFARVEFFPESMEVADDLAKYKFLLEEQRRPDWFSGEIEEKVIAKMKLIVASMIITGDADLLCGGAYILAKGARVSTVKRALIHVMLASSQVGTMWESSQVGTMWASSKVGEMWESSQVGTMRESSQVGTMWESSQVGEMWASSQVGEMRESSQVGEMWESSQVGTMRESSQVGEMWASSKVGEMWASSKVGTMWESSKVENDKREKKTEAKV